jgi:xylulokinase
VGGSILTSQAGGPRIVRIGDEASGVAPPGAEPRIQDWNPVVDRIEPDPTARAAYDELFDRYLRLYAGTADVVHELAALQRTP